MSRHWQPSDGLTTFQHMRINVNFREHSDMLISARHLGMIYLPHLQWQMESRRTKKEKKILNEITYMSTLVVYLQKNKNCWENRQGYIQATFHKAWIWGRKTSERAQAMCAPPPPTSHESKNPPCHTHRALLLCVMSTVLCAWAPFSFSTKLNTLSGLHPSRPMHRALWRATRMFRHRFALP